METIQIPIEKKYETALTKHTDPALKTNLEPNKEAIQNFFSVIKAVNQP